MFVKEFHVLVMSDKNIDELEIKTLIENKMVDDWGARVASVEVDEVSVDES